MSFHGLYLPGFILFQQPGDKSFFILHILYFVDFFIFSAFVAKCDEKDPYYCFTANSLVAVCACFLTDFH